MFHVRVLSAILFVGAIVPLAAGAATSLPHRSITDVSETHLAANAVTERVLYAFSGLKDGRSPYFSLLVDRKTGSLFGTTDAGGAHGCDGRGCGTVFKLSPSASGYTMTSIHVFHNDGIDGTDPTGPLVFDNEGNILGETYMGGLFKTSGTVFELTPSASTYAERILYNFDISYLRDPGDGLTPYGRGDFLVEGGQGRDDQGDVFKLTRAGSQFVASDVFEFSFGAAAHPGGGLTVDGSGNIFGTVGNNGIYYEGGGVFEITPVKSGYSEVLLHAFGAPGDGFGSYYGVILDPSGALFGVTRAGGNINGACGSDGCGIVFKLAKGRLGWTPTTLYRFSSPDFPIGKLLRATDGTLYGVTSSGGSLRCGTVYALTPGQSGYVYWTLYNFRCGTDGSAPTSGLVAYKGSLFGVTSAGGAAVGCPYPAGCGTAYEIDLRGRQMAKRFDD